MVVVVAVLGFFSRSGNMYYIKGKAKWDAWEKKKGTSLDEAKQEFILLFFVKITSCQLACQALA